MKVYSWRDLRNKNSNPMEVIKVGVRTRKITESDRMKIIEEDIFYCQNRSCGNKFKSNHPWIFYQRFRFCSQNCMDSFKAEKGYAFNNVIGGE